MGISVPGDQVRLSERQVCSAVGSTWEKQAMTDPKPAATIDGVDYYEEEWDDPFNDDTVIEPQCDLENPESCESCQ